MTKKRFKSSRDLLQKVKVDYILFQERTNLNLKAMFVLLKKEIDKGTVVITLYCVYNKEFSNLKSGQIHKHRLYDKSSLMLEELFTY